MLKRLELVGFKSFADKTQFDFAPGVTAIVGPNGSGKSNIVDAVRWILGEQSAKSLRGGEMADVIFNGSTSRRSLGLAEVTMTFDNSRRQLSTDAAEVQITRRVYRDGQGEYLINHHSARLKDIKDLFLGSGAGSNAYCIIEQGRVENLLQSSTKDRREIFEEAAGISRFKAKKTETLRRLERVDQNLQQLKLILDEVQKQLKQTRLQASKAQRYQEYSQRLQELRVALGLQEFHQVTGQLQVEESALEGLRAQLSEHDSQRLAWETETQKLDAELARLDAVIREQEEKKSQAREQILTEEERLGNQRRQSQALEKDLVERRTSLTECAARLTELTAQAAASAQERGVVEEQCAGQQERVTALEGTLYELNQQIDELKTQVQADRDDHLAQAQRAAHRRNDVTSYSARVGALQREHEHHRLRANQAEETIAVLEAEIHALKEADESLRTQLAATRQSWQEQTLERDRLRAMAEAATSLAADLKAQRSGLATRIEVLDALVRSHEGMGAGTREMFALLEQPEPGPWGCVLGMVADFLTVSRERAPLIDLALGDRAQHFVIRDRGQLHEALRQRPQPFTSRVGFLALAETTEVPDPADSLGPTSIPAVRLVTCDRPDLAHLPAQLLGTTRIVPDLDTACKLSARFPGLRFLTTQGALLEADGTLVVGTHHAETGILSRKSELRELREQVIVLERRIMEAEADAAALTGRAASLLIQIAGLQDEIKQREQQQADLRVTISEKKTERDLHQNHLGDNREQMKLFEQELPELKDKLRKALADAEEADRLAKQVLARADQGAQEIRVKEQQQVGAQKECGEAQVALAKIQERLNGLRATHEKLEAALADRRREQRHAEEHLTAALARQQESQHVMLRASAALAVWYLEKEAAERHLAEWTGQRNDLRTQRRRLAESLHETQNTYQSQINAKHQHELRTTNLRNQRDNVAARILEDYQLDLAALYQQAIAEKPDAAFLPAELTADAATKEVEELRRKKERLGNVNLEALQELADLEVRAQTIQVQFDDLAAAQKSLQDIIVKINHDSRKLFSETFATIRQHFQELFRKLFGGGMADIVLEDEADILESGIEVIARPPGKELRSISLMSGGEKTMTAVALLLAIFRSKPSPFCLLDEVDAALDEANIGRFTACLRDFLDLSQFILVTHSKKTMACADVLYGVTMQESGISKRVAVRFEDWPDDGSPNGTPTNGTSNVNQPGFAGR